MNAGAIHGSGQDEGQQCGSNMSDTCAWLSERSSVCWKLGAEASFMLSVLTPLHLCWHNSAKAEPMQSGLVSFAALELPSSRDIDVPAKDGCRKKHFRGSMLVSYTCLLLVGLG